MTTQTMDIMERAEMLPIDMKLELVDRLLESITPSRKDIEEAGVRKSSVALMRSNPARSTHTAGRSSREYAQTLQQMIQSIHPEAEVVAHARKS
jgi:hypothetical protein